MNVLLVALGGALGSVLRYGAGVLSLRLFGPAWPVGTLFVNVTGSFLMGLLVEAIARRLGASAELRLFLTTGLLGGYTTFSAFSLDALALYERGEVASAALYVGASVLLGLAAIAAGLALGRQIF
ncbi:fluoride efflux transporter CrcB [Aureimonas mangrovi]|uniref:fluoride efflux transporter CrcB n=1 Tax=Aureimonas mangrovi TaxID=2758041 RepID=UPI00163DE22E|nr:fluoride efflux transporter CrcB [Aureimonas mangrovi]